MSLASKSNVQSAKMVNTCCAKSRRRTRITLDGTVPLEVGHIPNASKLVSTLLCMSSALDYLNNSLERDIVKLPAWQSSQVGAGLAKSTKAGAVGRSINTIVVVHVCYRLPKT